MTPKSMKSIKLYPAFSAEGKGILYNLMFPYLYLRYSPGENASGAVVHCLQGSGGGEAPARSALLLVLHRGDRSVLPPVDVVGERGDVGGRQVLGTTLGHVGAGVVELGAGLVAVHESGELVVQQISKLVHGHVVTFVALVSQPVVLLNLCFVLHPDFHPSNKNMWQLNLTTNITKSYNKKC